MTKRILAAIARNVQMEAAKYNIMLKTIHIEGKNNSAADLLSRWHNSPDVQKLNIVVNSPQWIHVPMNFTDIDWDI